MIPFQGKSQCFCIEVISCKDGYLVAEPDIYGLVTTAYFRVIEHVIVEKRCRMDNFYDRAEIGCIVGHSIGCFRTEQHKERAYLFSSSADIGFGYITDFRLLPADQIKNVLIDVFQLLLQTAAGEP